VPDPLEFGIVIQTEDGRIERFLEKPTWGQVFSDTVNTGIYVMEPEVFAHVEPGRPVDWSGDVFPRCSPRRSAVRPRRRGLLGGRRQPRVVRARARRRPPRPRRRRGRRLRVAPGVWVGRGRRHRPRRALTGPLCIGKYVKVEAGAELRPLTVLGDNVVVKGGAVLERAVVHDNVFVGPQVGLRGLRHRQNTDVMRAARIEEGAVVGDECVVEEEAYLADGVKVYPFKTSRPARSSTPASSGRAAAPPRCSARAACPGSSTSRSPPSRSCAWPRRTPTTLPKGSTVVTARDASRAARPSSGPSSPR
jgi:mannose-1-phosphate guanylyltransferase/phosphomannomutase